MKPNRTLVNRDRELLKERIELMFEHAPDTMSRKISEANVQQAFILDKVLELATKESRILCVGSFEDTAMETLVSMEYDVYGVDPEINFSLEDFSKIAVRKYDIVFATSVLEHVEKDEEFIAQICFLLASGGTCIITCDFNNNYVKGDRVPNTVVRQYTRNDLEYRLQEVLKKNGCKLFGEYDWTDEPDFIYQGHLYSFATFVFRKEV